MKTFSSIISTNHINRSKSTSTANNSYQNSKLTEICTHISAIWAINFSRHELARVVSLSACRSNDPLSNPIVNRENMSCRHAKYLKKAYWNKLYQSNGFTPRNCPFISSKNPSGVIVDVCDSGLFACLVSKCFSALLWRDVDMRKKLYAFNSSNRFLF